MTFSLAFANAMSWKSALASVLKGMKRFIQS